jgi:hypothetical protein
MKHAGDIPCVGDVNPPYGGCGLTFERISARGVGRSLRRRRCARSCPLKQRSFFAFLKMIGMIATHAMSRLPDLPTSSHRCARACHRTTLRRSAPRSPPLRYLANMPAHPPRPPGRMTSHRRSPTAPVGATCKSDWWPDDADEPRQAMNKPTAAVKTARTITRGFISAMKSGTRGQSGP